MPRKRKPVLGVDYIMDSNGRAQFTREYLLKRDSCCGHDCRFCPFICASGSSPAEKCAGSASSGFSLPVRMGS